MDLKEQKQNILKHSNVHIYVKEFWFRLAKKTLRTW